MAQADVQGYYDNLEPLRLARWLEAHGATRALGAAVVRTQLLPVVTLAAGGVATALGVRTRGSLTGSRLAGTLGRVPVETAAVAVEKQTRHRHWILRGSRFNIATYVDNTYTIAQSRRDAEIILEQVEARLKEDWNLQFKPTSLLSMSPAGSTDEPAPDPKWDRSTTFPVLGHLIRNDGRQADDVAAGKRGAWAAFYGNPGRLRKDRAASLKLRLRLLDRCCTAAWAWRASAWAPTRMLALTLNATQRRMVASLLSMAPLPGEDIAQFVRRRGRAAGVLCRARGLWSELHIKRAGAWRDHLARAAREGRTGWAARMLATGQTQWLRERRAEANSPGLLAGATGTRRFGGAPAARWEEALNRAQEAGPDWHRPRRTASFPSWARPL